jgi:hypothetical protein
MKGWVIQPLGWLLLAILAVLIVYGSARWLQRLKTKLRSSGL